MGYAEWVEHREEAEEDHWYRNHYKCPHCSIEWYDEWENVCLDECPECHVLVEPMGSEVIE